MRTPARRKRLWVLVSLFVGTAGVVSATTAALYAYTDEELAGPEQPIEFSHVVHAKQLGIDCLYCHTGADKSQHATIPAVSVCMGCHATVDSIDTQDEARKERSKQEIAKLREFCGTTNAAFEPCNNESIPWNRVHWVPEHVQFKHMRHVQAGIDCTRCHGDVKEMNRVYMVPDTVYRWPHSAGLPAQKLEMGWCVECHQQNDARIDCAACHY